MPIIDPYHDPFRVPRDRQLGLPKELAKAKPPGVPGPRRYLGRVVSVPDGQLIDGPVTVEVVPVRMNVVATYGEVPTFTEDDPDARVLVDLLNGSVRGGQIIASKITQGRHVCDDSGPSLPKVPCGGYRVPEKVDVYDPVYGTTTLTFVPPPHVLGTFGDKDNCFWLGYRWVPEILPPVGPYCEYGPEGTEAIYNYVFEFNPRSNTTDRTHLYVNAVTRSCPDLTDYPPAVFQTPHVALFEPPFTFFRPYIPTPATLGSALSNSFGGGQTYKAVTDIVATPTGSFDIPFTLTYKSAIVPYGHSTIVYSMGTMVYGGYPVLPEVMLTRTGFKVTRTPPPP